MKIINSSIAKFISLFWLVPAAVRAEYSVFGDAGGCVTASGAFYDYVWYEGVSSSECALYANHLSKDFTVVGYETVSDGNIAPGEFAINECFVLLDNLDASQQAQVEAASVPGFTEVLLDDDGYNAAGPIQSTLPYQCFALDPISNISTPIGLGYCGDDNSNRFDDIMFDIGDGGDCEELAASLASDLDVVGYEIAFKIGQTQFCYVLLNDGYTVDDVMTFLPADFDSDNVFVDFEGIGPVSTISVTHTCYKSGEEPSDPSVMFELLGSGYCVAPDQGSYDYIGYNSTANVADCRSHASALAENGIEVVGFEYFTSGYCYVKFKSLYITEGTFDFFGSGIVNEVNLFGTSDEPIQTYARIECFRRIPGGPYKKVGDGICSDPNGNYPAYVYYLGTGTDQRCEEAADFFLNEGIAVSGYESLTYVNDPDHYACSVLLSVIRPPPSVIESRALNDETLKFSFYSPRTDYRGPFVTKVDEISCYIAKDDDGSVKNPNDGGGDDEDSDDVGSSAWKIGGALFSLMLAGWTGYLI
eukprot:scaffold25204_cov193-Amphora_coffeaeformis.AAC.6